MLAPSCFPRFSHFLKDAFSFRSNVLRGGGGGGPPLM